jgi:hypothetical protein
MAERTGNGVTLVEIGAWAAIVAVLVVIVTVVWPRIDYSRRIKHRDICVNNLRMIDHAKQQVSVSSQTMCDSDTPQWSELTPYFKGMKIPVCPDGGVYTINAFSNVPTCSRNDKRHLHAVYDIGGCFSWSLNPRGEIER